MKPSTALTPREIHQMKPAIAQQPIYLDYETSQVVEERAYTQLSVEEHLSLGPPLLKPARPPKYAQLQYNAPSSHRTVEKRSVSLPQHPARQGHVALNIAGRRVVSMPEVSTPTQRSVHARLSSAASHSRNTTFSDVSTMSITSNGSTYYSPSDSLRVPPSDLPQTPSPPSSPESVLFINNNLAHSNKKILHQEFSDTEAPAPNWRSWTASPPKPIPALHGPLSLPYARCPSGAEGTIVEGEDLTRMIWGLEPGDHSGSDTTMKHTTTNPSQRQVDEAKRPRTASGGSKEEQSGKSAHPIVSSQASVRMDDTRSEIILRDALPHGPRSGHEQSIPGHPDFASQSRPQEDHPATALLKPSAPIFVPRSPPGLCPSAKKLESTHVLAPKQARRMSAMEIAQRYRQTQAQPSSDRRPPSPEWTSNFCPYLEPISAVPTFTTRSRPVRHGFDDIYLPKIAPPIQHERQRADSEQSYREPDFDDYVGAERLVYEQEYRPYYDQYDIPQSPPMAHRPLPPVIGSHRDEPGGASHTLRYATDNLSRSPAASRRSYFPRHEPEMDLSLVVMRSPSSHRSPKPPGPPPNTPLPSLPARGLRRISQEYLTRLPSGESSVSEDPIMQTVVHAQPRSVPMARLMQRRLSAVPEELEDTSIHAERPPSPTRMPRPLRTSTVLRQPLPPSAQPSWRAKTKMPVHDDGDDDKANVLARIAMRSRRVVLVEEDDDPYRWGPVASNGPSSLERDKSKRVPLTAVGNLSRSASAVSSVLGDTATESDTKENPEAEHMKAKPKKNKVRGGRKVRSKKAANK